MSESRSAFITIVGKANVGKSSLLNRLIGEKIAIVSDKPQTTRTRITGVLTEGETQYVFLDTPGWHRSRNRLSDHMVQSVQDSMADVDALVMVVEPFGKIHPAEQELIEKFSPSLPVVLVINKIDLLRDKTTLLSQIAQYDRAYSFAAVVPLSAETGEGVSILLSELSGFAKKSVHYFADDTLTDQPERVIIAEILREKLLHTLRDEVPHGIAVAVEQMKERESDGLLTIHTVIYCEKSSHKGMIIGKGGKTLKEMATAARTEMEHFLGCRIHLECWVKVKEDWRNREGIIRSLGLS